MESNYTTRMTYMPGVGGRRTLYDIGRFRKASAVLELDSQFPHTILVDSTRGSRGVSLMLARLLMAGSASVRA